MRRRKVSFSPHKTYVVDLLGGLNENASSIQLKAGELISCKNYMLADGGYGGYISTKGYEAFDGDILPSSTVSYIIKTDQFLITPSDGDEVLNSRNSNSFSILSSNDSSFTLEAATIDVPETASLVDDTIYLSDGLFDIVDAKPITSALKDGTASIYDGTRTLADMGPEDGFLRGDPLYINGVLLGDTFSFKTIVGSTSDNYAGVEAARASVQEVPGDGAVLATYIWENKCYAFRKLSGSNFIGVYVEDEEDGWVEVVQDATPMAYVANSHNFKFTQYNFLATSAGKRFYWCDGVNKARACDGDEAVPITNSGMGTDDKPINIIALKEYLWLVYPGGSLQGSTMGDPLDWTTAPYEFGVGFDIVGLDAGVDNTLIIFTTNGIKFLKGSIEEDFSLLNFDDQIETLPNSVQNLLGTSFFLSNMGLTNLEAAQEYGDFKANTFSQRFHKTLKANIQNLTATVTSKYLNQYRMFFSSGRAIYVSFEGRKFRGATLIDLPIAIRSISQGEDADGNEYIVFSSDDGYVYRMDSGKSFNGNPIICKFSTAYYHYGSPRKRKAFRKATFEIDAERGQEVLVKTNINYNDSEEQSPIWLDETIDSADGAAIWGSSDWGSMIYGAGAVTDRVPFYINGIGSNMSYTVLSNEVHRGQHTIQNIITDYDLLGRSV